MEKKIAWENLTDEAKAAAHPEIRRIILECGWDDPDNETYPEEEITNFCDDHEVTFLPDGTVADYVADPEGEDAVIRMAITKVLDTES